MDGTTVATTRRLEHRGASRSCHPDGSACAQTRQLSIARMPQLLQILRLCKQRKRKRFSGCALGHAARATLTAVPRGGRRSPGAAGRSRRGRRTRLRSCPTTTATGRRRWPRSGGPPGLIVVVVVHVRLRLAVSPSANSIAFLSVPPRRLAIVARSSAPFRAQVDGQPPADVQQRAPEYLDPRPGQARLVKRGWTTPPAFGTPPRSRPATIPAPSRSAASRPA